VRPEGLVERGRDVETAKAVYFFPEDLYYHRETHYWVRPSGSAAVVGLDALAQAAMGDIVYITLKEAGHSVQAGERIGSVEAAKMVSFLVSPVSGRILRRNEDVLRTPSLVNTDPYGRGWLVEVGELACNRPFGSYRPGEEFRDYPFKPTPDDLALVRQELQLDGLLS
jgi:glycine cleavage system H protein